MYNKEIAKERYLILKEFQTMYR